MEIPPADDVNEKEESPCPAAVDAPVADTVNENDESPCDSGIASPAEIEVPEIVVLLMDMANQLHGRIRPGLENITYKILRS